MVSAPVPPTRHVVIQTAVHRIVAALTINSIAARQTVKIVRQRTPNQLVRPAISRQDLNGDSTCARNCPESVADAVGESSCTGYVAGDELHLRDKIYSYPQFRCADIDNVELPVLRAGIVRQHVDESGQQIIRICKYEAVIDSNRRQGSWNSYGGIKRIDVNCH